MALDETFQRYGWFPPKFKWSTWPNHALFRDVFSSVGWNLLWSTTHTKFELEVSSLSRSRDILEGTIRAGLRPNWAWCCIPEKGTVNRIFSEFLSKGRPRLCLSSHDSPKTRNCTNRRNHNQNREDFYFSRQWPWAYFFNMPNAAASTAPTLIRHWGL